LTYDVINGAACGPTVKIDAACDSMILSSVNRVPVPVAPAGARVINCGTAYYSKVTGDLNLPANWTTLRNGTGSVLGSVAAFATSTNSFYVQNGHTMTSTAALTMSNLYLEPGSYVLTNYLLTLSTLYIEAFATFEQTYAQTNAGIGGTYISSFYIKKDGTWKHNNNGYLPGNSATQYFEPYSIQWFLGVGAGTFPGGTAWGTVILDIPNAPSLIINATSISYIHGDFVIRRWGSSSNYFYINFDNPLYVDGDLIMSGAYSKGIAGFNCNSSGCVCTHAASAIPVNVAGDFIMSGGTWNDFNCGSNSSTGMAMTIGGNVSITGGTINMNNNAGSTLHLVPITASTTWSHVVGSVTLGNSWIDAGKTVTMTGTKLGDVASSRTITVATGATLNTSNYPISGAGQFTLATGATLGIGSANGITSSGVTGNIQVSGARAFNSGATYRYYEGLTPQATGNFSPTTTPTASTVANLIIDKNNITDEVSLTNTTNVTSTMTLTKGRLFTAVTAATDPYIRIKAGAAVSPAGGSVNSFVDGYMRKEGNTAFDFPTGNNARWRRIGIDVPSASTEFEARYIYASYTNTVSMAATPTPLLDHVSLLEHWILNKPGAAASSKVTLFWEDAAASGILKFDSLVVGRFNGAAWENTSSGLASPGYTTSVAARTYTGSATGNSAGTIRSNTLSSFSPFTFASIGVYPLNPLPIELVTFDATVVSAGVSIAWITATEINNDYFTVERSEDARQFEELTKVDGAGNSTGTLHYSTLDKNPFRGISYYRLRQTDFNGNSTTSDIVAVNVSEGGIVSVVPNPANDFVNVIFPNISVNGNNVIELIDSKGDVVLKHTKNLSHGNNVYRMNLSGYSKGVYVVKVTDGAGITSVKRFVIN
ncbi:MAG: T9SS type A sorting domain-containing protein, partial [Bacteroidia bacterium]|nr:T9SS type A sorting domain-containing protein [Bacteroidia bacterium]